MNDVKREGYVRHEENLTSYDKVILYYLNL